MGRGAVAVVGDGEDGGAGMLCDDALDHGDAISDARMKGGSPRGDDQVGFAARAGEMTIVFGSDGIGGGDQRALVGGSQREEVCHLEFARAGADGKRSAAGVDGRIAATEGGGRGIETDGQRAAAAGGIDDKA